MSKRLLFIGSGLFLCLALVWVIVFKSGDIFAKFGNSDYLFNQAIANYKSGDYAEALVLFEKSIVVTPECDEPYLYLGLICDEMLDKKGEAEKYYEQYLRLSKNDEKKRLVKEWLASIKSAKNSGGDKKSASLIDNKDPVPAVSLATSSISRNEFDKLFVEKQSLELLNRELESKNSDLRKELSGLSNNIEASKKEIESFSGKEKGYLDKIEALTNELKKKDSEILSIKSDHAAYLAKMETLNKSLPENAAVSKKTDNNVANMPNNNPKSIEEIYVANDPNDDLYSKLNLLGPSGLKKTDERKKTAKTDAAGLEQIGSNDKKNKTSLLSQQTVGENNGQKKAFVNYSVKKGDTLQSISKRFYGDDRRWKLIWNANKSQMKNIKNLQIGQILLVPKTQLSESQ